MSAQGCVVHVTPRELMALGAGAAALRELADALARTPNPTTDQAEVVALRVDARALDRLIGKARTSRAGRDSRPGRDQ